MKVRWLVIILALTVSLTFFIGCATMGGGQISGVNWALAKNGGRVTAFSEEPEHPASTLINGITSADNWDQGEGWQASMLASGVTRSVRDQRDEMERNWVEIELSQPITANEVKIYTVDSQKYPAAKFGVSDVLVQYQLKTSTNELIWANVKRPGKSLGDQGSIIRDNKSGVITVRFEPVNTQKIRVLIFGTNDITRSEDGRTREGTIRLTEIEVYGSGKQKSRSEVDSLFESK
ncbi:TPA: hypothetical protein ENX78_03205 [Candidatus Poribacteria bacterium]|nr:hypothetical protein [Candidatus Poribacteria bacterium]